MRIDEWWVGKSPKRRLDRSAIAVSCLFAFVGPTLSIVLVGPTPTSALVDMSDHLQIGMCLCILIGNLVMLHGALGGSRFYCPRMTVRRCYTLGYTGAPAACIGLWVYGYYLIENTQTWSSVLGAVLAPIVGAGIAIQAFLYWLEARRIEAEEDRLIAEAKKAVADDSDNS